jgi:hypothetical protein
MGSVDEVLAIATLNGRVCPQPQQWNALWELLPGRKRSGSGWEPPLPLILAAWWETSDQAKRERLASHIQYAAENGALDAVAKYLSSLTDEQWHVAT